MTCLQFSQTVGNLASLPGANGFRARPSPSCACPDQFMLSNTHLREVFQETHRSLVSEGQGERNANRSRKKRRRWHKVADSQIAILSCLNRAHTSPAMRSPRTPRYSEEDPSALSGFGSPSCRVFREFTLWAWYGQVMDGQSACATRLESLAGRRV